MLACIYTYILLSVYTLTHFLWITRRVFLFIHPFHISYTQAILWVLELDTLCSYFTGRRPCFVIKTNPLYGMHARVRNYAHKHTYIIYTLYVCIHPTIHTHTHTQTTHIYISLSQHTYDYLSIHITISASAVVGMLLVFHDASQTLVHHRNQVVIFLRVRRAKFKTCTVKITVTGHGHRRGHKWFSITHRRGHKWFSITHSHGHGHGHKWFSITHSHEHGHGHKRFSIIQLFKCIMFNYLNA